MSFIFRAPLYFTIFVLAARADIIVPMEHTGGLIGDDASFYCGIDKQESWEDVIWLKGNTPIGENNVTEYPEKYTISGFYELTVKKLEIEDEEVYKCILLGTESEANLTVAVQPSAVDLYTELHEDETNLTCVSRDGRPQAVFTWLRGGDDVTGNSYANYSDLNATTLYGDSWSNLPVNPDTDDKGQKFTCIVHYPYIEEEIARRDITFSTAPAKMYLADMVILGAISILASYTHVN